MAGLHLCGGAALCDIDGVLADFPTYFNRAANRVLGTNFSGCPKQWDITKAYGLSKDDLVRVWSSNEMVEEMSSAPAYHLALQLAESMGEGSMYCTARGSNLKYTNAYNFRMITIPWMLSRFPDHPIIFTDKKAAFARRHGFTHAVEDCPSLVEEYVEYGINVFMPVHPYNEHLEGKGITPLEGWH